MTTEDEMHEAYLAERAEVDKLRALLARCKRPPHLPQLAGDGGWDFEGD